MHSLASIIHLEDPANTHNPQVKKINQDFELHRTAYEGVGVVVVVFCVRSCLKKSGAFWEKSQLF